MGFDADAVLLKKDIDADRWDKVVINIVSVEDIHAAVGGKAEQVDLDIHHKVYYNTACYLDTGVLVHARDCKSNIQYLPSPVLLVLCDDEKPIDLDDQSYEDFFDWLSLY